MIGYIKSDNTQIAKFIDSNKRPYFLVWIEDSLILRSSIVDPLILDLSNPALLDYNNILPQWGDRSLIKSEFTKLVRLFKKSFDKKELLLKEVHALKTRIQLYKIQNLGTTLIEYLKNEIGSNNQIQHYISVMTEINQILCDTQN